MASTVTFTKKLSSTDRGGDKFCIPNSSVPLLFGFEYKTGVRKVYEDYVTVICDDVEFEVLVDIKYDGKSLRAFIKTGWDAIVKNYVLKGVVTVSWVKVGEKTHKLSFTGSQLKRKTTTGDVRGEGEGEPDIAKIDAGRGKEKPLIAKTRGKEKPAIARDLTKTRSTKTKAVIGIGTKAVIGIGEGFQANIPEMLKNPGDVLVSMEPVARHLLLTNATAFNFIVSGHPFKVLRAVNGVVDMEYLKVKVGSLVFVRFFTGTKAKSKNFPVIGNLGLDGEEAKVGSTAVTEALAGKGEVTITGSVVGYMVKMELCYYLRDCIDQHNLVNMNKAFQLYNQDLGLKV